MISPIFGTVVRMRVSTGKATQSDGRMFTVVVEGFGVGLQRRAERRLTVPFSQLQRLMQTIALQGGRILAISAGETQAVSAAQTPATDAATQAADAPAPAAPLPFALTDASGCAGSISAPREASEALSTI